MSAADIKNLVEGGKSTDPPPTVSRDVDVSMLDYKYIDGCSDARTLEKILTVLRSGKEGVYPHLNQHCEEKLKKLKPTSRYLRKENQKTNIRELPKDDQEDLLKGLENWSKEMKNSVQLETTENPIQQNLPPVRKTEQTSGNDQSKKPEKKRKDPRIRSYDYKSWDNYDVDEECKKVEEEIPTEPSPILRKKPELRDEVDTSSLPDEEKCRRALVEKDKGNEAFKSSDYDEALTYYSRSINMWNTTACINNRALTYLRLKEWKQACQDCDTVLEAEADNLKAKLRRATAYKEMGRVNEALKDLSFVLDKEPNNQQAIKLHDQVTKLKAKGRKMTIVESSGSEGEEEEEKVEHQQNGVSEANMTNGNVEHESSRIPTFTQEADKTDTTTAPNHIEEPVQKEEKVIKSDQSPVNKKPSPNESPVQKEVIKSDQSPSVNKQPNESTNGGGDASPQSQKPTATTTEEIVPPTPVVTDAVMPEPVQVVKKTADDFLRRGIYDEAVKKYSLAVRKLDEVVMKNKDASLSYSRCLSAVLSNRALCHLKLGDDPSCINDCSRVLELKPFDVKALMRRAMAYEHTERYKDAYVNFHTAYTVDQNARQAQDGANRLAGVLRNTMGNSWRSKLPAAPIIPGYVLANSSRNLVTPAQNTTASEATKTDAPTATAKLPSSNVSTTSKESAKASTTKLADVSPPPKPATIVPSPKPKPKSKSPPTNNSSKTKSEKTSPSSKGEKYEEVKRGLFETVKGNGNEHVKSGEFAKAVECYDRCLQFYPDEVACYTNRALCHLKLGDHSKAVDDCTKALNLHPDNIKALYRRGLAHRHLENFSAAECDFRALVANDPGNKTGTSQLSAVRALMRKQPAKKPLNHATNLPPTNTANKTTSSNKKSATATSMKKVLISEVNESSEEEGDSPAPKPAQQASPVRRGADNSSSGGKTADATKTKRNHHSNGHKSSDQSSKVENNSKENNEKLLTRPIKTPYEFGHRWSLVKPKTNAAAYKCVLDEVSPKTLPFLLSNKTDHNMIMSVAKAVRLYLEEPPKQVERAYSLLYYLSQADRFGIASMFLTDQDRAIISQTFDLLERGCSVERKIAEEDLKSLRSVYTC